MPQSPNGDPTSEIMQIGAEHISFVRAGRGQPVLLIHSLGTSSALWHGTLAALEPTHAVVAMDCRGHGLSTNRGHFSIEAVARDGLVLMSALGFDRFSYVGISMGGLIGIALNSLAPHRLDAMVLADSYAAVGSGGPARLEATRAALARTSMAAFAQAYVAQTLRGATPMAVHARTAALIASMSADDYLQTAEAILLADVSGLLSAVMCPTLVMIGDEDQRTPLAMSQVLLDGIDGATLSIVPAAAHLAVLDNPAAFNAALSMFLRSVAGR